MHIDMCIDMRIDMRIGMGIDMHVDISINIMWLNICMHFDKGTDMRIYM